MELVVTIHSRLRHCERRRVYGEITNKREAIQFEMFKNGVFWIASVQKRTSQ
jgi:hypothetical protein